MRAGYGGYTSVKGASKITGLPRWRIRKMCRDWKLPSTKLGKWIICLDAVKKLARQINE